MIEQAEATLRVGAQWVHEVAHVGDLEVVDRRQGGNWSVSWVMNLGPGEQPAWLKPSAPVEVHSGDLRWSGYLGDSDWDAGSFTADGWCRQAETVAAVDLDGPTNDLGDAIFFAGVGRGAINFGSLESLGSLPAPATEYGTLAALADQYALELGRHWRVNEDRLFSTAVNPTTPSLWVKPGIVDLSASTSTQVTHFEVAYMTTQVGRALIGVGDGPRTHERLISIEQMGPMSAARAQAIADEIFRRTGGGLPALTSGFEVAPGQVVNANGQEVDLSLVRPGRMIRVACEDPRTGDPWTDVVIDETQWRVQERRVQVNPANLDGADFEAIVEELGGSVLF